MTDLPSQDSILYALSAAAVILSKRTSGTSGYSSCNSDPVAFDALAAMQAIGDLPAMQAGRPLFLVGGCFRGASLPNRNFNGVILDTTDLRGGDLYGSHLYNVSLRSARLDGSNLSGALLDKSRMDGATACHSENLVVPALEGDATPTQFAGVDMRNVVARGAQFVGARFWSGNEPPRPNTASWKSRANLFGSDFRGANFAFAKLQGAELAYTRFDGANLTDANLQGATHDHMTTTDAIFCRTTMPDGTVKLDDCPRAPKVVESDPCPVPTPEDMAAIIRRYQ